MEDITFEELHRRVFQAVDNKSDRDVVITIVAWIDHLLARKLALEKSPSAGCSNSLYRRIEAGYAAGWIDADLRNDLHRLRSVRNYFAHSIDATSLSDDVLQETLSALRVPARQFSDWDSLGAAGMPDGSVVIFSGDRPQAAANDLRIGAMRFKVGLSVIFSVLLARLELEFASDLGVIVSSVPAHLLDRR
jgi:hypothetical protein